MAHRKHPNLDIQMAITPFAGVALILVLMLMITAQDLLTHEDAPVEVPRARTMEYDDPQESLTIAVTGTQENVEDRKLYLNDSLMTLPYIERTVQRRLSEEPYHLVIIRVDKSAPSEWAMNLLSMVKGAGAQRVALSTKRIQEEEATGTP